MRIFESIDHSRNQDIYRKIVGTLQMDSDDYVKAKDIGSYRKITGPDGVEYDVQDLQTILSNAIDTAKKFIGYSHFKLIDDDKFVFSFIVETMATDGLWILINPQFLMWLYKADAKKGPTFVILHEIMHIYLRHIEREAADTGHFSDHNRANIAQDAEINWMIENGFYAEGYMCDENNQIVRDVRGKPKKCLTPYFKGMTQKLNGVYYEEYGNLLFETIYDLIDSNGHTNNGQPLNNNQKNQSGSGSGDLGQGSGQDQYNVSDEFKEGFRDTWNKKVQQAIEQGILLPDTNNNNTNFTISDLFESVSTDTYTEGYRTYDEGCKAAEKAFDELINQLRHGSSANNSGVNQGPEISISDLRKVIPNFPVAPQNNNNSPQNNPGQSGQKQDNQSSDSGTMSQGGWNKDSMSMTGEHTISKQTMEEILKAEGYDERDLKIESEKNAKEDKGKYNDALKDIFDTAKKDAERYEKEQSEQNNNTSNSTGGSHTAHTKASEIFASKKQEIIDTIVEIFTPVIDWKSAIVYNVEGIKTRIEEIGWVKGRIASERYSRDERPEPIYHDRLLVFIDTSGSVWSYSNRNSSSSDFTNTDFMRIIISELNEIARSLDLTYIDLFYFHTNVYSHYELMVDGGFEGDCVKFPVAKSGGTAYGTIFDVVNNGFYADSGRKDEYNPQDFLACIIFTDEALLYSADEIPANYDGIPWADQLCYVVLTEDSKYTKHTDNNFCLKSEYHNLPYKDPLVIDIRAFFKELRKIGFSQKQNSVKESVSDKYSRKIINKLRMGKISKYKKYRNLNEALSIQDIDNDYIDADEIKTLDTSVKDKPSNKELYQLFPDKFKKILIDWIETYLNLTSKQYFIDNDGEIIIDVSNTYSKQLNFNNKVFNNWDSLISIKQVNGDVLVNNTIIKEFPAGFVKNMQGDFICINNRNLISLKNAPTDVYGDYIIQGSPRLDITNTGYLPEIVDGVFKTDQYNSLRDAKSDRKNNLSTDTGYSNLHRKYIKGPGSTRFEEILKQREEIRKRRNEPEMDNRPLSDVIQERALARKKHFKHLNEAFRKAPQGKMNPLSILFRNPENRKAVEKMREMPVMWSDIEYDYIGFKENIARALDARRHPIKGKYSLTLYCSTADNIEDRKINIVGTGNNLKKYANGNAWLYVDPECFSEIQRRAQMVQDIRISSNKPGYFDNELIEEYKDELDRLVPMTRKTNNIYTVKDVVDAGVPYSKASLVYAHLKLVPDYVGNAYIIAGNQERDNFDYETSEQTREKIKYKRELANYGLMVGDMTPDSKYASRKMSGYSDDPDKLSPQVKRYMKDYIDPGIVKEINRGTMSLNVYLRNIKLMQKDVLNMFNDIRQKLKEYNQDGLLSDSDYDILYSDIKPLRNDVNLFDEYCNYEIESKTEKLYYKSEVRRYGKRDLEGIRNIDNNNAINKYLDIIKKLGKFMAEIDKAIG